MDFTSPSGLEARLQSILDTALDAYVAMDEEGRILDWNRQAEATFGLSREEVLGRTLADTIVPPQYRDAHTKGLEHFLRTGEGPVLNQRLHIAALHRDGHEFPVELTIWPLGEAGSWTFHAFVRDVTELRETQRRAMESARQAAVAEIISKLAHDSSNPLQIIQMGTELLSMELPTEGQGMEHIAMIQKAREQLEGLVRDVHGCAIPLQLKRRRWNLAKIWQEAWAQLGTAKPGRDIELRDTTGDVNWECLVDRSGMEQVFRILLQNSLARCGDPVRIEIACREASIDKRAAIQTIIRDNGPELPREQWHQLFGIIDFGRLQGPAAELSIATRIVDAHGGRITASGRYREGAEFVITLPRDQVEGD
jgi:PAS domain S-box-containing protein